MKLSNSDNTAHKKLEYVAELIIVWTWITVYPQQSLKIFNAFLFNFFPYIVLPMISQCVFETGHHYTIALCIPTGIEKFLKRNKFTGRIPPKVLGQFLVYMTHQRVFIFIVIIE